MKTYTFQVSGQNDDGYLTSVLVSITDKSENDAEKSAEIKSDLNGPSATLIGIK